MAVFAIGDIHGCSRTFRKLVEEGLRVEPSDEVYCIGDYIDRGLDSKGVIDFILELRQKGYRVHTLRGNHEELMLDSEDSQDSFEIWMMNGGDRTLKSFGVSSIRRLDPAYLDFFNQTPFYIETDEQVFVHAGLNFTLEDPFEDKQAMLWIRNFEVDRQKIKGKLLVHGHTPKALEQIVAQPFESPYNIDGGCVYTQKLNAGLGHLVAVNLTEKRLHWLENCE